MKQAPSSVIANRSDRGAAHAPSGSASRRPSQNRAATGGPASPPPASSTTPASSSGSTGIPASATPASATPASPGGRVEASVSLAASVAVDESTKPPASGPVQGGRPGSASTDPSATGVSLSAPEGGEELKQPTTTRQATIGPQPNRARLADSHERNNPACLYIRRDRSCLRLETNPQTIATMTHTLPRLSLVPHSSADKPRTTRRQNISDSARNHSQPVASALCITRGHPQDTSPSPDHVPTTTPTPVPTLPSVL